jgi:hypothetical protein
MTAEEMLAEALQDAPQDAPDWNTILRAEKLAGAGLELSCETLVAWESNGVRPGV